MSGGGDARRQGIRFLLDEHYPGWLADGLSAHGVDTVAVTSHRDNLRGLDDVRVLESAVAEGRIVVTEDVRTFGVAIAAVRRHVGVVFCHHARIPRTRPGLARLRDALLKLAADPPEGLGSGPAVWWLAEPRG